MAGFENIQSAITNVKTRISCVGEKKFVNLTVRTRLQGTSNTMFAALKATALDLPLDNNLGFAYVIPFKGQAEDRFMCGKGIAVGNPSGTQDYQCN